MARLARTLPTAGVFTLILLLAVVLAGCGNNGQVPLKYEFKAGDAYAFDLAITLNGRIRGPGIPAEQTQAMKDLGMKMRASWQVNDVTGGVATVTYRYENLEMTQEGRPVGDKLPALPDVTVKMDKTGKVLSVQGLEGMMPPGLSGAEGLPFDPSQFSSQTNIVFPAAGLAKPGDEWSAESSFVVPGTGQQVTATTKARLVSVEKLEGRELATVDFSQNVPLDLTLDLAAMLAELGLNKTMPPGNNPKDLALTMTMKGEESFKGTTKVATENGVPESLTGDLKVNMVLEITEAPANMVPPDQRGPFTIDMTATLTMTQVR